MRASSRRTLFTYAILTLFLLAAVMPFVGNILT